MEQPLYRTEVDAWHGHQGYAIELVKKLKPEVIVELGVHKGDSLFSFCQGAAQYGGHVYGVDTWEGDKHAGFYDEEIFNQVVKYALETYPNTVTLMKMPFAEAVKDFEPNSIDLLHIDGLHTYEAVKADWESWLPKVKQNGVVLFHDITVTHLDFGVRFLWEEIKQNYATAEFHHCNGLGIVSLDGNVEKIKVDTLDFDGAS